MILGDSAGFLNSQRLKGIHLAIKSGMLAAETAFEALKKDDFSAAMLERFSDASGIELDQGRALEGAQLPSGLRAWILARHVQRRPAAVHRRPRFAQALSHRPPDTST